MLALVLARALTLSAPLKRSAVRAQYSLCIAGGSAVKKIYFQGAYCARSEVSPRYRIVMRDEHYVESHLYFK